MTGVRRRGYFAAAVAVMGAALLTAVLATPPGKPVDIRLVAPPPASAETITATATTTVSAVGPVVRTTIPKPAAAATSLPRQAPAPTSSAPSSTSRPRSLLDLLRCDSDLFDDDFERCLQWPHGTEELCEFLEEHDLHPREVRGRDGHGLDLDCDD